MAKRFPAYFRSCTGRLMLGTLLINALLLPLSLIVFLRLETAEHEAEFANYVQAQSHLLSALLENNVGRTALFAIPDRLVASGQAVFAEYQAPGGETIPSRFNRSDAAFLEDSFFGQHGDHVYYVKISAGPDSKGFLRIGISEEPWEIKQEHTRNRSLVLAGSYLAALLLMVHLYGHLLARSIQRLQEASRRVASGETHEHMTSDGQLSEISSLAADLEQMRQALLRREQDMAQREARQRAVVEASADGIIIVDADGTIETFNRAAETLFGCRADQATGTCFTQFLASSEIEKFWSPTGQPAICSGAEMIGRRSSGEEFHLNISVNEALAAGSHCFTIFIQDISERLEHEARLAHLATHDALTGLPNRALFDDRLKQVLAHAARGQHIVALFFLDLDRFKHINDTLGHHVGDELLRAAARRLTACMRSEDTLARLGGDEFTLILPHLENPASASVVAENIIRSLEKPFPLAGKDLCISCSIGIAFFPIDGQDAEELSRNADAAMYAAKRQGGHGFQFYSKPMGTEAANPGTEDDGLRSALERSELQLYYQPQVDVDTLRIVGVEALLRWQHPERGLLSPAEFIPRAEATGAIQPMGEWVLATACRQARAWQDEGLDIPVAINLSASQFKHPNLVDSIGQALAETGLKPQLLNLELTEGMLMEDHGEILGVLWQLKRLGVILSLDDFGQGYSSLNRLKQFPIDILKINQAFIAQVGSDSADDDLAATLIAMAHSLHMRIVAEGVETAGQRTYLRNHGCDAFQGLHFSQPLPCTEATDLLRHTRRPSDPYWLVQSAA